MIGTSDRQMIALLFLGLIPFTITGYGQSKQELGDRTVARIEQFRRSKGRLPNSLAEVGLTDTEHSPIGYCIDTDSDYLVFYLAQPGQLRTYNSKTKKWDDTKGGACIVPATTEERDLMHAIGALDGLQSEERAHKIAELALEIRRLPVSTRKVNIAAALANSSTDGEFDRDAAQQATTSFEQALREHPTTGDPGVDGEFYRYLAELVRYEHMHATLENGKFSEAVAKLAADDERREKADFTLADLNGKSWRLRDLRGKVVLVNFFAIWCAPCVQEMPDLEALYEQYQSQGLIILGITPNVAHQDLRELENFLTKEKITYPILVDKGNKVQDYFDVALFAQFVYRRDGKLVSQSPYIRTRKQLRSMLVQAGIQAIQ